MRELMPASVDTYSRLGFRKGFFGIVPGGGNKEEICSLVITEFAGESGGRSSEITVLLSGTNRT